MSIRFRLCKNDITTFIRDTFNAHPLRVPETKTRPLMVVARKDNKTDHRGELKYLLDNGMDFEVEVKESKLANTTLDRSRTVNLDFGLKILEGFLSGFNLSPAPIGASLKGVTEMSFSFTDTLRFYVDVNELGTKLKGRNADLGHPSIGIFTKPDAYDMLLISDVIASKSFTINIEKTRDQDFNASMPALQAYIADVDAKVKIKMEDGRSITFTGDEYLTFAFTCVMMEMDKQTGALKIGESVITKGGTSQASPYVEMDDDEFEPGMFDWDN